MKPYLCAMVEYENTIISEELFSEEFVCNLSQCKGACCIEGDAGAPLSEEEADLLDQELEKILPYLPQKGQDALLQNGSFSIDQDGEYVTTLVNGKECAFTHFDEKGMASCGIELAWKDGKTNFRKPVSCHLYPIRLSKLFDNKVGVNYHKWSICSDACTLGQELKVPVYKFLKEPLVRHFGAEWYKGLEDLKEALDQYYKEKNDEAQ